MKTYEIHKIPLWPVARIAFVVYLVLFGLIGMLYAVFTTFLTGIFSEAFNLDSSIALVGPMAIFIAGSIALSGAVTHTLLTLLAVILYNASSSILGGIHLELEEVKAPPGYAGPAWIPAPSPQAASVAAENGESADHEDEVGDLSEPESERQEAEHHMDGNVEQRLQHRIESFDATDKQDAAADSPEQDEAPHDRPNRLD